MKPVTLTDEEMIACRLMGNMRTFGSIAGQSRSTPYNGWELAELNQDSFIGEYAFCKHWNLFFDITATPRRGGYDCVLHGQRMDIKTTQYLNGKLMVKDIGNNDIDVYVLALLDGNTVSFPGYCAAKRLKTDAARMQNQDGSFRFEMEQSQLTPWKISQ